MKQTLIQRLRAAAKALGLPFPGHQYAYDIHPVGGPWWNGVNGRQVSADANSIVTSCLRWVGKTFPEAPVRVWAKTRDDEQIVHNHPLALVVEQPNPFYGAPTMWKALLTDYLLTGNAYLKKVRGGRSGTVLELWWMPASLVEPKWNSADSFVDWYDYNPHGESIPIPAEDIIHFRDGLDPENPRKGKSAMASVLGEIYTDNEASAYTRTILSNMGVPGVLISPDTDTYLADEELEDIKAKFEERFTGNNRGRPMVMTAKTSVQMLSFSPQQLDLKELRRIPEERITAVFGLPAIIAGLGAGLDRSTFANYAEARAAAWEDLIIPMQRDLATAFQVQLLAEYGQDTRTHRVGFDVSNVRVLQEDQNALMTRLVTGVSGAILTPNEARKALGYDKAKEEGADHLFLPGKVKAMEPTKADLDAQAHADELAATQATALADSGGGEDTAPGGAAGSNGSADDSAKTLIENVTRWLGDTNGS